jgi:hypothetical protein
LDVIGEKYGVRGDDLSPWYKVARTTMRRIPFAHRYNSSHYAMLKTVYPEHTWMPWKFHKLPVLLGRDPNIIEDILKYIAKELKIVKPEDWYGISKSDLRGLGVGLVVSQMGGLFHCLKTYKPEFDWEEGKFHS